MSRETVGVRGVLCKKGRLCARGGEEELALEDEDLEVRKKKT